MNNNKNGIQISNLSKKFQTLVAVNGVNLKIKSGELFSLLGPNGAGKTTIIKMLCCLLKPTSGTAIIMGNDIKKDPFAIKQIISVSPQETAIAGHLNARENLYLIGRIYGLSKKESKNKSEELIELMELTRRAKEQVRNYSGGMQRRLSIVMALISDPQVLFLDEPTLGLDPHARRELWKQIERLKGKKTILLTTHYLEEADALSDRIAIIKNGNIIAQGTSNELKNEFLNMQTMLIRLKRFNPEYIESLKRLYSNTCVTENGIEIKAKELDFDKIVDFLRDKGAKIEWITMKEPTLDDVFLSLTEEEVRQ